MKHAFKEFDRTRLRLRPLAERTHDLDLSVVMPLAHPAEIAAPLQQVGEAVVRAKAAGSPVIVMMGAHVIRSGVQRFLIDLMARGFIDVLAVNGAVLIHDFELALIGATTESVARYIADGQFGLWQETGELNDIVTRGAAAGQGLGETVGRHIAEAGLPHAEHSIAAAAWRHGVLMTCHVGIGYDIIHEHPNMDGAAFGAASYRDFLRLTHCIEQMEGGVLMNLGSAVMGPEIFLKGLAMARNAAGQEGRTVERFTTLVTDLVDLPGFPSAAPDKSVPQYYFRPWKTLLDRTVAGHGQSHYYKGRHADAVPMLWSAITRAAGE